MVELNRELIIEKCGNEPTLDFIILSNNNINKIDPNAFKEFTALSDNNIEELEGTLFESFKTGTVILL